MKSSKKEKNNYKYNKITQQKKFHLLNLVLGEKMLIKDVIFLWSRQQKSLASTTPQPKQSCSSTEMEISPTTLSFRK